MNAPEHRPYVVLAAVDDEDDGLGVLDYAIELAAITPHAVLHVASIVPPIEAVPLTDEGVLGRAQLQDFTAKLRDRVQAAVTAFRRRHPPRPQLLDPIQVHCAHGTPVSEIPWIAVQIDADLIIVGSHGRKGLRRLVLGSVAEGIMRNAPCPVLVVRAMVHGAPWCIPEIEPVCADCAEARRASAGAQLWCAPHAGRHFRAHVVSRSQPPPGPSATESITGT